MGDRYRNPDEDLPHLPQDFETERATTTTPSLTTRRPGAEASAILADMSDGPPLANLITLGAHDFTTLRDFYRRLGWSQVMDSDDFAAFELRGIVLAVFPLDQ